VPTDDGSRGVYMISVAAELAGMHPQTLRIYETRGLITTKRSPKNTRLYSQDDVERLRRIQELTEMGMNLAGVERVFELEDQLERATRRIAALEKLVEEIRGEAEAELEAVRRAARAELVHVPRGRTDLVRARDARAFTIPVERGRGDGRSL
jgi:MerR family transcriptional regulator, heat shock protein HspR